MTADDVVSVFLSVCPSIGPAWQKHLAFFGNQSDRGEYNDAGVIAHHLVESFERGEVDEFPAAFAVLEGCFGVGDAEIQNLAAVGVIEGIQNVASHRPFGPNVFLAWLRPKSRAAWDKLNEYWTRVAEAKQGEVLGPAPDQPARLVFDPNELQTPAIRRIAEQLFRK